MKHDASTVRTVIDLRDERPEARRIVELAAADSDPGWIAGRLNREGYHAQGQRPWSPEDVLAVLHGTPA
jgi:hypothetical protein